MNGSQHNPDWNDALIDRGLAEIVGNETPPDLTEKILAAEAKPQASVMLATPQRVSVSRTHHWVMFASAACALIALGTFAYMKPSDSLLTSRSKPAQSANNLKDIEIAQSTTRPGTTVELPEFETIPVESTVSVADGGTILRGGVKVPTTRDLSELNSEEEGDQEGKMDRYAAGSPIAPATRTPASPDLNDLSVPFRQGSFARDPSAQPAEPTAGVPVLAGVPHVERMYRNTGDGEQGEGADATLLAAAPPVVYPESKEWDELTARRKKYASTDLNGRSEGTSLGRTAKEQSSGARFRIDAAPGSNEAKSYDYYMREGRMGPGNSGDQYAPIEENDFITAKGGDAVSTFSIDVDTASYANVRQFLEQSAQLPPPDAVRIEELVNYFPYDYEQPTDDTPFAANMEVAACPWNPEHRLARIAIKGKEMDRKARPQSNLVFLIDVSGSMDEPAKLPLLIEGMKAFTRELGENDKVAIVVYASSEGMALPSTRGDQQQTILSALDNLRAGGSTAGGAGIELAYKTATENFIKGGTNRVILCTDGDFNVGVTSTDELTRLAEQKAKETKVFLTVLGFGRGNLNDAMMESISGKGNGNYHYVDNLTEARKVLVEEMTGTLVTIAKDVKIQVEFNPAQVSGYRLIGYENRMLATQDFNDDKKDAGEIGAGHTVTALYEIVPAGKEVGTASVNPLKYQEPLAGLATENENAKPQAASDELLTLKLRYKLPEADTSTKIEYPITDKGGSFADASDDFQFAASVASFGMMLRHSQYKGQTSYDAILEIAQGSLGEDHHGYRAEFLDLVRTAKNIAGEQ